MLRRSILASRVWRRANYRKLASTALAGPTDGAAFYYSVGSTLERFRTETVDPFLESNSTPASQSSSFTAELPRAKPSGVTVLRGARVITMRKDEVLENADIVVTGNRISAIGARGSVQIPPGAHEIDAAGRTIMPGIIDAHAHWMEIRRGVLDADAAWPLLANLAYGVTTGRDPQTSTNDMFAYQDLVDTGDVIGPRLFNTGPGIFAETDFQSLDDARRVVSRYARYYRTNTLKSYTVGNRKQREWMVMAAKEFNMMPTTEGALDLKLDITHAIDGFSGNEHALPIVPLQKDVVELFARSGISYTPTLLVAYGGPWAENFFFEESDIYNDKKLRRFIPRSILYTRSSRRPWFQEREHIYPRLAEGAARIQKAGGRVVIGGHGQLQGIQCHWEMPLGDVGDGLRRNEAARRVAGGDSIRSAGDWLRVRSRIARAGEAGGSADSREESAGKYPEHEYDSACDEERRGVRREHAEPSVAESEAAGSAVVVDRSALIDNQNVGVEDDESYTRNYGG